MTKTLFKKQMMELFSFFWQDKKKNKNRTGIQLVLSVSMYLALFGIVSVMLWYLVRSEVYLIHLQACIRQKTIPFFL